MCSYTDKYSIRSGNKLSKQDKSSKSATSPTIKTARTFVRSIVCVNLGCKDAG